MKVTLLWYDEDDMATFHVFHGSVDGPLTDFQVRMDLLHTAMASALDDETFAMASEQMTTHIVAIFNGHIDPAFLPDGSEPD